MLIGRTSHIEVPVPPFVTPRMQAMRESMRSRGVPEAWIPACSEYVSEGSLVVDMGVGGQFPQRTLTELLEAAKLGLGLNLYLDDGIDLRALSAVLEFLPRLSIAAIGKGTTGWNALLSAPRLERLRLTFEPNQRLDLSIAPLRSFEGVGAASVGIAASPNLTYLELDRLQRWPEGSEITGALEHLQLSAAKGIDALPPMADPSRLAVLRVHYPRRFDLRSLAPAQALERVEIAPCPVLLNCETLLELPRLREVSFAQVREMNGWEALASLGVERFTLSGNWVIPARFASLRPAGRTSGWSISPMKSDRSRVRGS